MMELTDDLKEDIEHLRKSLEHVAEYNAKYHPGEPPYDLVDVIQQALPSCDGYTYFATAEHLATMIEVFDNVPKVLDQCHSSLKRAIERSNELHKMAIDGGATPQNQGQFIALLESTMRDIERVR